MKHGLTLTLLLALVSVGNLHAAERVHLTNGFSLICDHRERIGESTRLYLAPGSSSFMDVPTHAIDYFEVELVSAAKPPSTTTGPGTDAASIPLAVQSAGKRNALDSDFITSVIRAESGFHPQAVSRKGAKGLMQLMPGTAQKLGVQDSFDTTQNVDGGAHYLSDLLDRYHGDTAKALAAYNAGPGAVDKYHGVPPYRETRQYVARIIRDYNRKKLAERRIQHTSRAAKAAHPATHHRTVVVAGAVVPAAGN